MKAEKQTATLWQESVAIQMIGTLAAPECLPLFHPATKTQGDTNGDYRGV
jgi:hypothetical protein